jgi:hypothetical protein
MSGWRKNPDGSFTWIDRDNRGDDDADGIVRFDYATQRKANEAHQRWLDTPIPPTEEETRRAELIAAGEMRDRLAEVDLGDQQRRDEAWQQDRAIASLRGLTNPIPPRP